MKVLSITAAPLVALLASETLAFSPKFAHPSPQQPKGPLLAECSSLYCSDDKVDQIYNNSLDLFLELQNMLADLRDEKISHGIDREHKKNLDVMVGYPSEMTSGLPQYSDYESDDMGELFSEMHEPVPYIHLSGDGTVSSGEGEYGTEQNEAHLSDAPRISSQDEEEIDRALARIEQLERENGSSDEARSNERKYLR